MASTSAPRTLLLRDLPFAARLTIAVFMVSVGVGYVSALIQLHFQHATPGSLMPTAKNAVDLFHGPIDKPDSKLVTLVLADESLPFKGTGEMSRAFTTKSAGWKKLLEKTPGTEAAVRKERMGERDSLVAWARAGHKKEEYENDEYVLPEALADAPITAKYLKQGGGPRAVKIQSLINDRCAACHKTGGREAEAAEYPLDGYETLSRYLKVETSSAMSLIKLAQTTHVHLLGFSMLYGLTGLILAFSSYPRVLRVVLCPLPLVAQVADISFWWLARLDAPYGPMFATAIIFSGAIVAAGLMLHIVLVLWDLFNRAGKTIVLLLLVAAAAGGYMAKTHIIDPYVAGESKQSGEEPAPAENK
jgi:hypothetical protein